jgi:hypothetical protein
VNHGDAAPLAAGGIVPASFLSRGACIISKKKKKSLQSLFSLSAFMPRRRRLPSPSIFPRPPPKSIIVQFGPVKGQNSSTAPDERVDPPAIRRRCALLLSSRSSQLSCRCLSSRLHRPSRYYLKGGVRSQSPSRALGQRRIFSFISWALRIPLGISSQLIWFFGSRPRHFHRHLWGLLTTMDSISCVNI